MMRSCFCLPFNYALVIVAFPICFFILSNLSLISATSSAESSSSPWCPQGQFCGKLNISYPFFMDNYTNWWPCGLQRLRCTINDSSQVMNSREENDGSTKYEVQSIDYSNKTVLVHDTRFTRDLLNDNQKCNTLFDNFTVLPIFRHLSAQVISPNLTLRVCKRHQQLADDHASSVDFDNVCKVEALRDEQDNQPDAPASRPAPDGCKLVNLPVDVPLSTFQYGPLDHRRLSKLFTVGFRFRWSLPQQCHKCDRNGTVCLPPMHHQANDFFCVDPKHRWNHEQGNENHTDAGNKTDGSVIGIDSPSPTPRIRIERYGQLCRSDTIQHQGIAGGVWAGILFTCILFLIIYQYRTNRSWKRELENSSIRFGVPIFSYAELEEATNNFSSLNELGDGGFGTVYRGKLRDGRVVAVKHLHHNNKQKHVERFMNEIEILTRLRHQNLVTLYGCTSYHSRELLLVYEFLPNGTVADHLYGDRIRTNVGSLMTWPVRMSIAIETARALSYLHASDVIHRDVKTTNILLDNHFHVKVADFGLCRLFPMDVTHISTAPQGTPGYVDPDYHRSYQLTDKSDVYSFGVVLIELISSKPAVDITRHPDEIDLANMAMNKIQNGALHDLVDPFLGFESDCTRRRILSLVAELAFRCLQNDKEMRPSMDEVLGILLAIGGEEYKVDNAEVMDILVNYDAELPKNIPSPPPSSDSGTDKLISPSTMPSTSSG